MPIIEMPNGDRVKFPDGMSREEIHHFIRTKFPDAPEHRGTFGQVARGVEQGVAGSLMDIASIIPNVPFLGGELPGLPEYARQARRQATGEAEKFVNERSEGPAQGLGKIAGGALPYMAGGPIGIAGPALRTGMEAAASAGPLAAHAGGHALGYVLGVPPWLSGLARLASKWVANHPSVAAIGPKIKPAMGAAGEKLGNVIESRAVPLAIGAEGAASTRKSSSEPEREPEPKKRDTPAPPPRYTGTYRGGREDRAQME